MRVGPDRRGIARRPRHAALLVVLSLLGPPSATREAAAEPDPPRRSWTWFGDALLRGDFVRGFPGGRDDVERARLRVRGGVRKWFGPAWELTAAGRGSVGTDGNDDNVANLDNEESDALGLDRLSIQWFGLRAGDVIVGKSELVPPLGPLLWDADLRPVGVAYAGVWNVRALDTLGVSASWVHPDHPLEQGSTSRLGVLLADWRIHEGAPTNGSIAISYSVFSGIDGLVDSGLARTNRIENGRYASEFELLDLHAGVVVSGHGRWPVRLSLDSVTNLGARRDDEEWGGQLALRAGRLDRTAHWELAFVAQRIQRDAVLAAFNSDDWWFPSATRGWRAWAAYAVRDDLRLRLSHSAERRDDLTDTLHRSLIDVIFEF